MRRSAETLRDAVGRYHVVSSISVYADWAAPQLDEQAPLASSPDLLGEDVAQHYGALKAACEGEVAARFGARTILVRPGLMVGPFEPTGRFTYRVQRVAQGGSLRALPRPEYPPQFIAGRDLAAWLLDRVERGGNGAYNACGPAQPMTFGAFVDGCRSALGAEAEFVRTREDFLAQHGVAPWTELPLWAGDDARGLNAVSNARAHSAGPQLPPLAQTAVDTARWAAGAPASAPAGIGLSTQREAQRLREWRRCSRR